MTKKTYPASAIHCRIINRGRVAPAVKEVIHENKSFSPTPSRVPHAAPAERRSQPALQ